jgi:putative PIN family toxin of toxin-antitoxin system
MLRIVLDTNVLVSAIISDGKPRHLLRLAARKRFLLILSDESIKEFVKVLRRPKFRMTDREVRKAEQVVVGLGRNVNVTSARRITKNDPDDDTFINTALDGSADYIVTGDIHLLELSCYRGIEIVSVDYILRKLGF